jgi:long-chain acyl-CoA synthetase
MHTLQDFLSEIERLQSREAVRWSNGFRTWVYTYAELYGKIGAVVRHFDERDVGKGDRILIWAENRMEWIAVFWACVARGIQIVPADFRFSPDLVDRIRTESSPKLVIDNASLDEIAKWPPCAFQRSTVTPDDVVEIVYTSGTTGEPKGVVHRHRNICSNLRPFQNEIAKYKKWARPFQPVRILDLLPLSHMFGQSLGLFMPVFLEGAAVFTNEIHPGKIIQFAHDHRISVMVCVPRILENLKNEVARWQQDGGKPSPPPVSAVALKMWRHKKLHRRFGWKFWAFVVGAARVDPDLEEFWRQRGFAVIQGYGLTEASMVIAVNHPFNARTGSVGKVLEGQDVQIAPDGEILVRGENVTTSDGGWLHTGDLGEIDSEGRLYFRGRKKNVIVTPDGLNVYPDDIETVLNSFPEVRESAVVGTDHVHAVLILKDPSANVDSLVQRANSRLESHQRIRDWSIWPHNEFPRTASTLKLKRYEIARQLHAKPEHGPSTRLPDLSAISSLERVELLSELENKYQIALDEDSFAKLASTRELENWLRRPEIAAAAVEPETPPSEWARRLPIRWLRTAFQDVIATPLYRHYLPLTVTGLENLHGLEPPVIFAANHTSHLDVPTIYAALPRRWHRRLAPAMMKEHFRAYFEPRGHSLKEIMLAGFSYFLACSLYNAYPLPQKMAGTRRALAYTGELINRGYCPIVFPEGLRTADGKLQTFRPGIGMMAVRLQVPIVPIRLSGLYEIYSLHDSWPRRGPIRVSLGAPMSFKVDTSYEEIARRLQEVIASIS